MTTIAVIYSSKTGKTRKTAEYIAKGLGADSFDLKKQTVIDLSGYDKVIFGTGIHAGKPYKGVVEFLEKNQDQLKSKKVSLFICCMFDDEKGEKQCTDVSQKLGISDSSFFAGKGDKNEQGFETAVDSFTDRMRA